MLVELHIENLGVIEQATLEFGRGVTALTGETGAGKTMLVEAIELLVGARADPTVVRYGRAEARVDGRLIDQNGDEIVLTRVVPTDGRSRAYVNGRPSTVSALADICRDLIDLHGQHAHQSLLSVATQRSALDTFGAIDLEPLRAARARLTEIDAELAALGGDDRARAREIDLLRFQVAELDAAGIHDPNEDTELATAEATLADAVAHREAADAALEALRGDAGTVDTLAAALLALGERLPFQAHIERLRSISAELDDVTAEIRAAGESIEEDPEQLDLIRQRRQLLVDLRRKYGDTLADVMEFHRVAEDRLRELVSYDARAATLDRARAEAVAAESAAAREIGLARRGVAPRLAAEVQTHLQTLAMANAAIGVSVGDHPDDHPGDNVRFELSANPGSPLLPLSRVASGGELARTMLALRLVLTGSATGSGGAARTIDTLVFDEVDAGIGGAAATAVGRSLADLGRHHQVLVVTHLPQVAALADRQLVVTKRVEGDETFTSVRLVDGEDRVGEVARMLSGDESNAAREHARELLGRS